MENQIINHDTNYPMSASRGGDNAYYLRGCETVGRSPSYASCLYKIDEVLSGRESDYTRECAGDIKASRCAATGMRMQEQLQGVALFYFPRKKYQALHLPVSVTGDFGVRITNLTDPALIPKDRNQPATSRFSGGAQPVQKPKSILDSIDQGSYAEAISTAAQAQANEQPPAPIQEPKKQITKDDLAKLALPGESLVQTAKRLLNKHKETA